MKNFFSVVKLGIIDYITVNNWQKKLVKLRQNGYVSDTLLLAQHPSMLSSKLKKENSHSSVVKNKVNYINTEDYNESLQLCGYLIFKLRSNGYNRYQLEYNFEEVFIKLLKEVYNIKARRDPKYPGVWINKEKILSINIEIDKWVCMNGFVFEITENMKNLHNTISISVICEHILEFIEEVFGQEIVEVDKVIFFKEAFLQIERDL